MPTPDTLGDTGVVEIEVIPPAASSNGQLWYDPDTGGFYVSVDGVWTPVAGAGDAPPAPAANGLIIVSQGGIWVTSNVVDGGTF